MHSNGDAKPKSGTSYSSPPSPIGHQEQFMPADNRAATATTTKTPKTVNIAAALPTWTPNTGIIDLPNEILRDIFLSVDEAFSCTLWSLSLTCKHFRAIVEEHCEPEYNLRGKKLENPVELLELLCDRPHLRNSIRVANIQYQHDFVTCGTPADTLALVNRLGLAAVYEELLDFTGEEGQIDSAAALLVVSLPKLETFHVRMFSQGLSDFNHLIACLGPLRTRFTKLRHLTLSNTNTGLSPLFDENWFHEICALPLLVRLKLQGICFDDWSRHISSSNLKYLDMEDFQENFVRAYFKKLQPLQALKHLRLGITDARLGISAED